jgi:hypothetical protein
MPVPAIRQCMVYCPANIFENGFNPSIKTVQVEGDTVQKSTVPGLLGLIM